jgi:tetratricopeptide (TPR) repeat protein
MAAAARRFGRIAYQPQPHLAALLAELQAGRAVVVLQNLGLARYPVWHFAVAIGYDAQTDTVILRSGEKRRVEAAAFNFVRTWDLGQRWALVVLRPGELPAWDDVEGYLRAASAAEAARASGDMIAAYQAAVTRWPDSVIARFGLANAFRRAGDNQRAIQLYLALPAGGTTHLAARNNLADALNAAGCRALALETVEAALHAASPADPLRDVLLQTRGEIVAHAVAADEPADCARWAQHAAEQKDREAGHAPASPRN